MGHFMYFRVIPISKNWQFSTLKYFQLAKNGLWKILRNFFHKFQNKFSMGKLLKMTLLTYFKKWLVIFEAMNYCSLWTCLLLNCQNWTAKTCSIYLQKNHKKYLHYLKFTFENLKRAQKFSKVIHLNFILEVLNARSSNPKASQFLAFGHLSMFFGIFPIMKK